MRTAHEHVRIAQALTNLPLTSAAFGRGELSYSRVRAITRIATPDDEAELVGLAMESTGAQLEKVVQLEVQQRAAADTEAPYVPPACARMPDRFGREVIRVAMDPSAAELVWKAIEVATCADAERSLDERRADALVAICDAYLAGLPAARSGSDRTRISIVSHRSGSGSEGSHAGDPDLPALDSGRPLPQAEFEMLECDASRSEVVIDADGVATIGKTTPGISATLRRQLMFRDGGCVWPGCGATRHLHAHHVKYRSRGGPTVLPNLVLLCGHHHRVLHRCGYSLESFGGRWKVRRPDGSIIDYVPPTLGVAPQARRQHLPKPDTIVSRWDGRPLELWWWEPLARAA